MHWDYVQKANYAVQDFNETIANKTSLTREDIVFAITFVDWICDAVDKVLQCYRDEITAGFTYTRQDELNRICKYFRAVRSFVNAHPLGTDRHRTFELDGTYFCIDIRGKSRLLEAINSDFRKLTPDGMEQADSVDARDALENATEKLEVVDEGLRTICDRLNSLIGKRFGYELFEPNRYKDPYDMQGRKRQNEDTEAS